MHEKKHNTLSKQRKFRSELKLQIKNMYRNKPLFQRKTALLRSFNYKLINYFTGLMNINFLLNQVRLLNLIFSHMFISQ